MSKAKILVVEDESIVSEYILACLGSSGYQTVGVITSGEAAIEEFAELDPDLILMDIRLNGPMSGTEAARLIRNNSDVPIIFLTAYADKTTIEMAKESEPYGYLVKPFYEKELHTTIEMALHKHQKYMQLKKEKELYQSIAEIKPSKDSVFVRTDSGLKRIRFDEIYYVEALKDYINIFTADANFTAHTTMKEILSILPEKDFIRVHKSFIARLDKIVTIKYTEIEVDGMSRIVPIGSVYRKDLYNRLNRV
ncbi:MAG: response regulator [Bacteroidota bacterium]